jgi:hypothetical protein
MHWAGARAAQASIHMSGKYPLFPRRKTLPTGASMTLASSGSFSTMVESRTIAKFFASSMYACVSVPELMAQPLSPRLLGSIRSINWIGSPSRILRLTTAPHERSHTRRNLDCVCSLPTSTRMRTSRPFASRSRTTVKIPSPQRLSKPQTRTPPSSICPARSSVLRICAFSFSRLQCGR